ncbi:hypothetical protein Poli38472_002493 [Pythium oligandrum]|uniref:Glutathione S-transferase n=1 Tax=Pythium oligandrum TaxID=41045 RepID=A0A8K1CJU6_PYTOL|nr:hypothetical protein Poli38472_002493 [Pythium oligandrum]|eukprot:TMW63552.1 hypothetical protein Poli38472_002493 [Pythium oligandrum]
MATYPKLKLTYFDAEGLGEAIRLAFFINGVPFEDVRLTWEQFPAVKSALPYGSVPILEIDGQVLAEAQAIARYAGRLTDAYPLNDPIAALMVDEIFSALDDFGRQIQHVYFEKDPAKQALLAEPLVATIIPLKLALIDTRLGLLQEHKALADPHNIYIHELWLRAFMRVMFRSGFMTFIPGEIVNSYKHWTEIEAKVEADAKVQQWVQMHHAVPTGLKLISLDTPDQVEFIRLALRIGKIAFEDTRVDEATFEEMKSALPYHQLPVLHVDDRVFAQSMAIARYAGTLAGLYPVNDLPLLLKVDELLCRVDEILSLLPKSGDQAPEAPISEILISLNKRIGAWSAPYATGEQLTLADLAIFGALELLKRHAIVFDSFLHLTAIHELVAKLPEVQRHKE